MIGSRIKNSIIAVIIAFMTTIRPLLGPSLCKYPVTCTKFAQQTLQTEPFLKAMVAIIKRLLSCNPF